MTSGFLNSAGTDLDDIFAVTNNGKDSLGLVASDGKDLGVRYPSETALGYSVGILNAQGTDLGYLRGASISPTIKTSNIVWNPLSTGWAAGRQVSGYFDLSYSLNNLGPSGANVEVKASFLIGNYSNSYSYGWIWSGDSEEDLFGQSVTIKTASPATETTRETVYSGTVTSTGTKPLSMYVRFWTNGAGNTEASQQIVLYYRFYNSFGTTDWVRKAIRVGS